MQPSDAPKITGGLTAAYGLLSIAAPGILARQTRQLDAIGIPSPGIVISSRLFGIRDVISGTAMVVAPPGRARNLAVALRATFDLTDGIVFARALPDPAVKRKVFAVAAGWSLICAASGVVAARS